MVNFPITGPYREILLALEMIIILIIFENSLYFFQKYRNNRKNANPSFVEFDWGVIFLAYAIANIFYLISAFFYVTRINFHIIGHLSIAIGGLIFSYHVESTKIINTKYIFTFFSSSVIVLLITFFILAPSILLLFASASMIPAFGILIYYFLMVCRKLWNTYKRLSMGLFIGIILWFLGFTCTSDLSIIIFNEFYIRVYGDIFIIIGMLMIGFFLNFIPSLSEIGWAQKIKYIILLNQEGLCLFNENFKQRKEMNEVILAGALSGIRLFIKETLKNSPELKVISKEKEVFLLDEGKYIIGVLVVEQELEILKYLLKKIIIQFEEFFDQILKNWDGKVEIFSPARNLIHSIFAMEKYI